MTVKTIKYGKSVTVEESPSGKTWKIFIRHAFWDKTVGIRDKIVNDACDKFDRILKISVGNPPVTFSKRAWKIKLEDPILKKVCKFPQPMKFYMVKIPPEKLAALYESQGANSTDKALNREEKADRLATTEQGRKVEKTQQLYAL